MKAKAWRLYGASDLRLEDVELESAGMEGVLVEIVANSVCVSDYKSVTLGAAHKRVPDDVATNPIIPGHEMGSASEQLKNPSPSYGRRHPISITMDGRYTWVA